MRVRVATKIYNSSTLESPPDRAVASGYDTNIFDGPAFKENGVVGDAKVQVRNEGDVTPDEQRVLDRVAEDLARLGRVKRVGLGVEEKIAFLKVWGSRKR